MYERCIQNMENQLKKFLPVIDVSPNSYYDAEQFKYIRTPSDLEVRTFGRTIITIQAHGSKHIFFDDPAMNRAHQPSTDGEIKTIDAYVAGLHKEGGMIIVDDDTEDAKLVDPARLFLTHVINFRLIEIHPEVLKSIQYEM